MTDPNLNNNSATDTDTLTPQNDINVAKVDNKGGSSIIPSIGTVVPGTSFTYTITVSNSGPSTATNVSVSDPVPSGLTSFVWSGNGHTNVSGAISDTIASLAPGASVVYTVTATVNPSATGTISNAVTVSAANDTNPNNNSATDDIDILTPQNDVSVTKTDNKGGSSITGAVGTVVPGNSFIYTVTVSNAGTRHVAPTSGCRDPVPTGLTSFVWSAAMAARQRRRHPERHHRQPAPGRQRHLHGDGHGQPIGHRPVGQHQSPSRTINNPKPPTPPPPTRTT